MCKLNKYTDVYPGNRVVHHSEHEFCSRSRNGKPCDRAQEFRYPTEYIDSERLSPRATHEQYPPTPPRSSRSPSTSDSERPRRQSESYYANGGRVDVSSHKPPSPRRERADHVKFVEATSVPRNATRRSDVPSSRRPPSPYEDDFEVYETSYREPASDTKSNVSTTSSTSSKHSTTSKHSNSSKHSSNSSTTSKDSKESKSSGKHSKKNYDEDERDERDSSPPPAARPAKKVLIAEDPSHKSHRRQGSKTREYDSGDEDDNNNKNNSSNGSNDKVRYYTPGEEVQTRINRHNEEIANRPPAPVSAPKSAPPKSAQPRSSPPKSSSKALAKVASNPAPASSARAKYRRGSVQVDDTMALTAKLDDLMISRQQAAEKEKRRQEREDRALQDRLKERLQRRSSTYGAADAGALTSPRHRNEPSVYRY